MSDAGQAPKTAPSPKPFLKRCWEDIEDLAVAIVGDMILFLIVLAGLTVVSLMLRFLGLFVDYDQNNLKILEMLHFWVYFGVLAAFMVDLLWKIGVFLCLRWSEVEK